MIIPFLSLIACIWSCVVWWLCGAALLYRANKLPDCLGKQWLHGLLWPLYLLHPGDPGPPTPSRTVRRKCRPAQTIALLLASAAIGGAPNSEADTLQEAILAAAHDFLTTEAQALEASGPVTTEIAPLDPRLRLADCGQPLHAYFPQGAQMAHRTTIAVECTDTPGWRVHLRASVSRRVPVTAWRHDLPRGHLVTEADTMQTELAERDLPRNTVTAPEQALGAILRQPVRAGDPVRAHVLYNPPLVTKGEQVSLTLADPAISITASVIALANGGAGDRIRVKSLSSDRELDAVVVARGLVEAL